jgi:PAS domain S-box-containing protein
VVLGSIGLLWISLRSSQSALRRSVEELTVGEGRYARLVSNIPGAVYTRRLRPDGGFDHPFVSPGFREMFGIGNRPWDGDLTTLLQQVHPDDRQALQESVVAAITGDAVCNKEFRVLKPNGQLSWVRSQARRYRNEYGETLWDGIVIDISDIRHHEALLEQVQRTAGLGYWTWEPLIGPNSRDLKQRSAHYSDACAAILDLADEDRDISDADFFARIVHPDDQDRVRRGFERFLASDTLYHDIEYRIVRRDKTVRWLRGTATKETAAGTVVRIVGVMLDVTDIKAREAQLVQAQKMEAVGELTGGIAHDFNNLLTVVIGNLEALVDSLKRDSQEAEIARDALSAADRGATLTKRLLAFSRRQPLSPQPTDLPALVNELMPLLKRSVGELVQVAVKAEPALPAAIVDPHQLENAVINLANNARDAMPRGGTLTVELGSAMLPPEGPDADGNDGTLAPFLLMAISDTGVGMAPDVLARAIQPFFTTKPVGQGTGLGLSMVYGLIRQSKGHMRIYSEPGIGTTIKLYLPQAMTDAVASTSQAAAPVDFSGRRALLVDDDEQVRATTAAMLRGFGFDVSEAASGKEALAILERDGAFDVMVTDVILAGGMLGPDMAERARALHPRLQILFISGFSSDVVGAGSAVLTKPFRRAELARRLAEIMRA